MAARKVYHVATREKGGWTVKAEGNARPTSTHPTKAEAVAAAKTLAKKAALGQVVIHGRDGRVQNEYTYGGDPRRSRG